MLHILHLPHKIHTPPCSIFLCVQDIDLSGINQLECFLVLWLWLAFGQWKSLARGQRVRWDSGVFSMQPSFFLARGWQAFLCWRHCSISSLFYSLSNSNSNFYLEFPFPFRAPSLLPWVTSWCFSFSYS